MNKINLIKLDKNKLIELINRSELSNIDDILNGLELLEMIKAEQKKIPVILVSALDDVEVRRADEERAVDERAPVVPAVGQQALQHQRDDVDVAAGE